MDNLESEWERIENMFSGLVEELNFDLPIILRTIRGLRSNEYSDFLRPGSSLYTFIISRSKRYGLRGDQSSISILAGKNKWSVEGGEVLIHIRNINGKNENFRTSSPLDSKKFMLFLEELINSPIN